MRFVYLVYLADNSIQIHHLSDIINLRLTLHVVPIDDNLNDTVPDLFTDVIARDSYQIQNNVHVPLNETKIQRIQRNAKRKIALHLHRFRH